ncbi:aminotransferase class V-fold PLP-dependent enzyme [Wenyingzhuangia sp. 2_MG-2023]|uniref:aminotransferase class V-fold PLP-dependent enzyme n=1 Tax=Wenyingzhuangia sp. 2_MG-2023 TaxID=3062639 RepID=UPI0026E1E575|nr:cysteine desulfurase [Wenyingzhuangia sp. 2_MG-2023]MDO6736775.1 cysteine desulfurase [Wenyingzhuangia sp. 2_MG-2023]
MIHIDKVRADFPILSQQVNGKPLVYFDNGATSQKPQVVIDAITNYYSTINSNVHRGVHTLSQLATDAFEETRRKLKAHFNPKFEHELIFTKGTTEGINLVATTLTSLIKATDEIIVSALEHHSNIVPWQLLCERTGATLKVIPMNDEGELKMDVYESLLTENTKIVAVNHISNALGTVNPIAEIIEKAHKFCAWVLIDGAQSCPHMSIDLQAMDCDFFTCSAHKMLGPTGIGFLYGKEAILNQLPPYHGGGEMIKDCTFEKTTYAELPHKFEAGTPNIADVIAFGTALDYINTIGLEHIEAYEHELLVYGTEELLKIPGLKIYGTAKNKASVISFNIGDIHPFDIGTIVDKLGIAVRTGHHCTQPIMARFDIPGTVRASFAFYNTKQEIDALVSALQKAVMMLS